MSSQRILFFGIEDRLAAELAQALGSQRRKMEFSPYLPPADCLAAVSRFGADLVCCSAQRTEYAPLMEAFRIKGLPVPVVIVTRRPVVSEWLDALEGGAADYFGPPFEAAHIAWIFDSAMKSAPMARCLSVVH